MKGMYGRVAGLLAAILLVAFGLTAVCGVYTAPTVSGDTVSVVASFYPMYTATLRVAAGSGGVSVHCLTQPTGGCLHDYQLSPAERAMLDTADVLILNGGGAEDFLSVVLPQVAAVTVDTTADLFDEEHAGHTHGAGEHAWLEPTVYRQQVERIADALCATDPANAALYRRNAAEYRDEIDGVIARFSALTAAFDGAVLFHESMAPFAEVLGLTVLGELPLGEDTVFSATEVAAVAEAVRDKTVLFLYDEQYPLSFEELTTYAADGCTLVLGSAVQPMDGVADAEVWLHTMNDVIAKLQEVTV